MTLRRRLLVSSITALIGCSSPSLPAPPAQAPEPRPAVETTPPAASATPSSPAPPITRAGPSAPAGPLRRTGKVPAWTLNGTDPASGMVVVRCENGAPPDDHSGRCACEGYDLDVCVDGVSQLRVSGNQCGFKCKPRAASPPTIAVRCADTTTPTLTQFGCVCGKQKPIDPCVGGLAGSKLDGDTCVISCRKPQP